MSDVILLAPSIGLSASLTSLVQTCKQNLLSKLTCRILREILCGEEDNKTYLAKHKNWVEPPQHKIRTIDENAVETRKFETADYTLDKADGKVTFNTTVTDVVEADYTFFPFTDSQLNEAGKDALIELGVLIYRNINELNIPEDYRPAICKRLYTNILKVLLLEARDFFSVAVGGRTIDKTNIVPQINAIIEQNEKQLQAEINVFRHFNKTNRISPKFEIAKIISADAFVGQETTQNITSDAEVS